MKKILILLTTVSAVLLGVFALSPKSKAAEINTFGELYFDWVENEVRVSDMNGDITHPFLGTPYIDIVTLIQEYGLNDEDEIDGDVGIIFKNVYYNNELYFQVFIAEEDIDSIVLYKTNSNTVEYINITSTVKNGRITLSETYIPDGPDETRPAISGQENFVMNVNEGRDVQYFIGFLRAMDDVDGNISDKIQIEKDNFTANKRVLGKHSVTVYVVDNAGNRTDFEFFVNVADIDAPVISGNTNKVRVGYKEVFDIENYRKTLTVSDNYDTLSNADIKLKTDGYTSNKTKLGNYDLVFEAKDSSNNIATLTKPLEVYDNIAPVFSGTEDITKSYTKTMTLTEILSGVTANDEIDGNVTGKIKVDEDGFSGNGNKVGKYTIKLSVTDNAGNKATRVVTVNVIDDQAPVWYIVNGVTINLTPDATLTRTQIVELLAKTGQVVAHKNAVVTYVQDTYSDNVGTPGVYTLAFSVANPNGVENSYTYGVNILDDDNTDKDDLDINDGFIYKYKNELMVGSAIVVGVVALATAIYVLTKKRKSKKVKRNKTRRS